MTWLWLLLVIPGAVIIGGLWDTIKANREMRRVNDTMNNLEMYNARFTQPQDAGDAEDC